MRLQRLCFKNDWTHVGRLTCLVQVSVALENALGTVVLQEIIGHTQECLHVWFMCVQGLGKCACNASGLAALTSLLTASQQHCVAASCLPSIVGEEHPVLDLMY